MTTPAKRIGLNVGDKAITLVDGTFAKGTIITLIHDDESDNPRFKDAATGREAYFGITDSNDGSKRLKKFTEEAQPKFPIDSLVEVVASGWGLGPERIGQVLTVKGFTLRHNDTTIYHVVDGDGVNVSLSAWEPSFKASVTTIPTVPAIIGRFVPKPTNRAGDAFDVITKTSVWFGFTGKQAGGESYRVNMKYWTFEAAASVPQETIAAPLASNYTALQTLAVNTFQGMYDAAVAYREERSSRLNGDYGICDNIDRFADMNGANSSQMSEVKENLIRTTASYSGNYTYPVPCPEGGDASSAFSRASNKWKGAYGLNRLVQLGQMLEIIKSDKWHDGLVKRQTPAQRNGLTVGDIVRYTRRSESTFWVLRRDDESMSPSFHKLLDKDDYTDLDLNYIVKVDKETLYKERPVSEFLEAISVQMALQADLDAQILELQKQRSETANQVAMLDLGLAEQHKVKRI
jgi:hypothetical protein